LTEGNDEILVDGCEYEPTLIYGNNYGWTSTNTVYTDSVSFQSGLALIALGAQSVSGTLVSTTFNGIPMNLLASIKFGSVISAIYGLELTASTSGSLVTTFSSNATKLWRYTATAVDLLTPLSQANFFPDLMQVKVLLPVTDLIPTLVHLAPALAAALAGINGRNTKRETIDKNAISFLFMH
jgi:hypothetical protein